MSSPYLISSPHLHLSSHLIISSSHHLIISSSPHLIYSSHLLISSPHLISSHLLLSSHHWSGRHPHCGLKSACGPFRLNGPHYVRIWNPAKLLARGTVFCQKYCVSKNTILPKILRFVKYCVMPKIPHFAGNYISTSSHLTSGINSGKSAAVVWKNLP